ncbi:hypothetical protein U91I_04059 [alpha proteobacterium U9-1i]|nr:hypothetical protein U91I_04059 [alpha proteobacterium U9-1i]
MSEDWRKRLRNMRTLAGLKREDADASVLDGLDADALRAAADNPDHSEAGRALAASRAPTGRWRLAVPGFIKARDLARGQKLFFGWGRVLRKWSGLAFYLVLLAILAAAFIGTSVEVEPSRMVVAVGPEDADLDNIYGFVGLAALLPLLIWFLASALRRKPARVLLLRKFNVRAYSEPLERAISNEFRPFGHIASLSDEFIRRDYFGWVSTATLALGNPLAALWFIVGAPIRLIYRLFDRSGMGPAVVLNARDFRNLARRLRDRIGLNLQVAFTSKEAFLVRTSDAWWRQVIRLFFDSSDVILVDLTKVTAGTAWELDTIRDEQLAPRCVFISLWGQVEEAQAALAARGIANPVHPYAPDGHMVDRHRFRAAMLGAMTATHPS